MRLKIRPMNRVFKLLPLVLVAVLIALAAASCGSSGVGTTDYSVKLPPGATEETVTESSSSAETSEVQQASEEQEAEDGVEAEEESTASTSTTTEKTSYLSGANFTVVSASREDSNEVALTSGAREVAGDYLQIEMAISNVGDELVDLSDFSFRLWNPAIDADLYEDYYGTDGTYGGYVSENMISATLLDYETLQPVSYTLRIGEMVDNVFLFFDLNPQSTARNEGVTMAGTNLVIYDTDTGDSVEINLAGYSD